MNQKPTYQFHDVIEDRYRVLKAESDLLLEKYACFDIEKRCLVKLLLLSPSYASQPAMNKLFAQWADSLIVLPANPNIQQYNAVVHSKEEKIIIVAELIPDTLLFPADLAAFKKSRSLSAEKAIQWSLQLLNAFSVLPSFTAPAGLILPLQEIKLNYLEQIVISPVESFWPLLVAGSNRGISGFTGNGTFSSEQLLCFLWGEWMVMLLDLDKQNISGWGSSSSSNEEFLTTVARFLDVKEIPEGSLVALRNDLHRMIKADAKAIQELPMPDKNIEQVFNFFHFRIYDSAIDKFREMIAEKPADPVIHALGGLLYDRQEIYPEALFHLSRAIECQPDIIFAYGVRGWLLNQLEQKDLGAKDFHTAFDKAPNDAFLLCCHVRVLGANGNLDDALQTMESVCQLFPNNAYPHYIKGWIYNQNDYQDEALKAYRSALEIDPGMALAAMEIGLIYLDNEQKKLTVQHLDQAVSLAPSWGLALYNRGCWNEQNGYPENAIADYKTACQYNSIDASPAFNCGNIYRSQGKSEEATECYLDAVRRNPYHLNAQLALGNMYGAMNMPKKAIGKYKFVIKIDPSHLMAIYNLAVQYIRLSDYEEALHFANMALSFHPGNLDVRSVKIFVEEKLASF